LATDGFVREFLKAVLAADQVEEVNRWRASLGEELGGHSHVKHARAIHPQPELGLVQSLRKHGSTDNTRNPPLRLYRAFQIDI
jgi:hypothetical protein